jgi:hypothetical protein
MSCKACEDTEGKNVIPIRVGNEAIGYGHVLIVGCELHAKLAYDAWKHGRLYTRLTLDALVEGLYDLSSSELRKLALEALLISDGPDRKPEDL